MRTIAILVLAAAAAAAEEVSLQVYDVSALTIRITNFRAPSLEFGGEYLDGPIGIGTSGGEEEGGTIPGDDLKLHISQTIAPGTWDSPPNSIEYFYGRLVVIHTKSVHEKVKGFLAWARAIHLRHVVVEADVIGLAPGVLADGAEALLTPEQAKAIDAALADPARGRLLASLRAQGLNGQRTHATARGTRSYVRDWNVSVAGGEVLADPWVDLLDEGYALDVRSLIAMEGRAVLMEVRYASAELVSMAGFDHGDKALGPIALPEMARSQIRTTILVPAGRPVLLSSTAWPGGEKAGWRTVVIVRAGVPPAAAAPAIVQEGEFQFQAFDVRALLHAPVSFAGPRLGLPRFGPSEPTTTFVPPEDEDDSLSLSPEALETMIKSNVDPDSWLLEGRTSVAMTGNGDMLAVNRPATLKAMEAWLRSLEAAQARVATVEAWVIGMKEDAWRARRESLAGVEVEEAVWAGILAASERGDGMRLAGVARCAGKNGVRFHTARMTERSLVVGYDVLSAQNPTARDPEISSVTEGLSLDARVVATGDGKQLRIDLRPSIALVTAPETFELQAQGARVQTVSVVDLGFETQVLVNAGRVSLAGSSRREEGGETEILLLFVRARVAEVK